MKPNFIKAKEILESSKVIAFPTETVMGLGVYFDDFKAYELLNSIKRRPEDKPYTLMLGNIEDIEKYAYVDNRAKKVINTFMPGEITILLRSKDCVPSYVTHGTGVIGIRVPNKEDLLELLNFVKKPLLVPSANRSGEKPAMSSDEVKEIFKDEVYIAIEGKAIGGVPSTLVDLTDKEVKIYREGNIKLEDIKKALGEN